MVKNRKGFTLVELLAAIVILGILMVFSVPIIVGLLDKSRDKIYVDDAKKLISKAEYQMRSSSNDIEIPDPGDCIVMSLVYLDDAAFDSPPNKGEYERERSYVVVKNDDGKLKYSAMIVEKIKGGGYKGVELTTNEELYSRNATKHVKSFKLSDLKKVEDPNFKKYINDQLPNYIDTNNSISNVYNYPNSYNGNAISGDNFAPKIKKAVIHSNSSYYSLDAKLSLFVTDEDTPTNKLKVCVFYTDSEFDDSKAVDYGNNEEFTYDLNFATQGFSYNTGGNASLYVIVKDPQGNIARKTLAYSIEKNAAPEIKDDSTIDKRGSDSVNKTTALVTLSVSDDISSLDKLSICTVESVSNEKPTSCNSYKPYHEVVSDSNTFEYAFKCNGTCARDGSTHYLNVFIKDEQGLEAIKQFAYTFSTNTAPTFVGDLNVQSKHEPFTNSGSKDVNVEFNVKDDIDPLNKLKIEISDGTKTDTYTNSDVTSFEFSFANAVYNGSTRNITVTVTDSEGLSSSKTFSNYTLYNNKKPNILSLLAVSSELVCTNPNYACSLDGGGSKNVNILLSLSDDIDYKDNYKNVKVCVSDRQSDCSNKNDLSNYTSYSNYYETEKPLVLSHSGDYNGQEVTIYAYAIDTSNELSDVKTFKYKLYENQAPKIGGFNIVSNEETFTNEGSLNIKFSIEAEDDFDDNSKLVFKLYENNVEVISDYLVNFANKENNPYTITGGYDGREVNLKAVVVDSQGLQDEITIPYTVYRQKDPIIDGISIESYQDACTTQIACSDENENNNNNIKIKYSFDVSNPDSISEEKPLGDLSVLEACVSETNSCSNYKDLSEYYNLNTLVPKEKEFTFTVSNANKPYDGSTKTLYVFVRKKGTNKVVSKSQGYVLYKNSGPVITKSPELNEIEVGKNLTNVSYSISAEDDLDSSLSIEYCRTIDGGSEYCMTPTTLNNNVDVNLNNSNFFKIDRYNGQVVKIYSKISDSYGVKTKSEEIEYKLHADGAPVIDSVEGVYNVKFYNASGVEVPISSVTDSNIDSLTKVYTDVKVSFNVNDPMDNYVYCISDTNSCTNYTSEKLSGSDGAIHIVAYNPSDTSFGGKEYYLFVKDDYGNVVSKTFIFSLYSECSSIDNNSITYEYEYDSTKAGNQPISMNRCGGKCYYHDASNNEYNDIVSYYKKKVHYTDRFNSSKQCIKKYLVDDEEVDSQSYEARCDFYKCFEKSDGTVNTKAIGTKYNSFVYSYTDSSNHVYECNGYYNLYVVTYDNKLGYVTITKQAEKICDAVFNSQNYSYTSSDPYVRIAD